MKTLISPLHTANFGKATLRFFVSPRPGADFPFHVHDDLLLCLGLPRELRRHFKHKLINDWKSDIKTVATDGGIVTVAPHYVAQGLIGACIEVGQAHDSFEGEYARAAAEALKIITAGWSIDEIIAFARDALHRPDERGHA